jgi:hypothetical protein
MITPRVPRTVLTRTFLTRTVLTRIAITSLFSASVIVVAMPGDWRSAHADFERMRIDFDDLAADGLSAGTILTNGTPIADRSGSGNNGMVITQYGGGIALAADTPSGLTADFPDPCVDEPCPDALVQIDDDPTLDPATSDFEWGARVMMQPGETADGENVVQKGLFEDAGGQWKLQVDKAGGLPSCVVSGSVPGQTRVRRVVLKSSIGVADGRWHQVTCRRTAAVGVEIEVDGVVRGLVRMALVDLNTDAPVTIGAKTVGVADNDQFLGRLDDVFMTVLDGAVTPTDPPPPVDDVPAASFASVCTQLVCDFDGSGSADDSGLTFAWDFGDGTTDTVVRPTHTYSAAGTVVVTLTVTDDAGQTDAVTQTIELVDTPERPPVDPDPPADPPPADPAPADPAPAEPAPVIPDPPVSDPTVQSRPLPTEFAAQGLAGAQRAVRLRLAVP